MFVCIFFFQAAGTPPAGRIIQRYCFKKQEKRDFFSKKKLSPYLHTTSLAPV